MRPVYRVILGVAMVLMLAGCGGAPDARPTIQRPQGDGQGQGVTVAVSEEQMNQALGAVLGAAQDAPIESLSVDLRPGVVGVSASALVEGRPIAIQLGLAPTVQGCALSLTVAEEPAKPDGVPAPVWDALVEQIVTSVEAVVVTPQNACVTAAEVSDDRLSLTIGR